MLTPCGGEKPKQEEYVRVVLRLAYEIGAKPRTTGYTVATWPQSRKGSLLN